MYMCKVTVINGICIQFCYVGYKVCLQLAETCCQDNRLYTKSPPGVNACTFRTLGWTDALSRVSSCPSTSIPQISHVPPARINKVAKDDE